MDDLALRPSGLPAVRRTLRATPFWVYSVALVPAAAEFVLLLAQPYVTMASLIRDPAALSGGRFYYGFVSNLGVILWCATASVCLFRGAELLGRPAQRATAVFMLSAGLFTAVVLLDDFFMLHEEVIPTYLHIPEKAVLLAYALMLAFYLALNWRLLLAADAPLLALALGFFALSNLVDMTFTHSFYMTTRGEEVSRDVIVEEGAKFVGISAWTTFHLRAAWNAGAAARA